PDFNGDGVVNSLDLAIWQQNVGITAGATVLQGDANGDGRVDGQDFLIWQSHLGPYPGAGSGSSFAVIPEPTSIALVLMSGLAWLPLRRRSAG
ncbi:MAG TPA: dockerin type I domain-containing protein, partial [Lacipirellulaceae bacterium]|nr:dockerin type I domain-containing protein [Lacipirellulaceae bacterium]